MQKQRSSKRFFTHDEDQIIMHCYQELGITNWKIISSFLSNRTPKNCRDRYFKLLDPTISNIPWNPEEDDFLLQNIQKFGKKWATISFHMKNRSPSSLKNRWHKYLKNKSGPEFQKTIPEKQKSRTARLILPPTFFDDSMNYFLSSDGFWQTDNNWLLELLKQI
jgi:hypothetical protein